VTEDTNTIIGNFFLFTKLILIGFWAEADYSGNDPIPSLFILKRANPHRAGLNNFYLLGLFFTTGKHRLYQFDSEYLDKQIRTPESYPRAKDQPLDLFKKEEQRLDIQNYTLKFLDFQLKSGWNGPETNYSSLNELRPYVEVDGCFGSESQGSSYCQNK
jgi:hypothetical protein